MHASTPQITGRGIDLLLDHFAALDRLAETRPEPFDRLCDAVGPELARLLVDALAGEHGIRARRLAA